MLVGLPDQWDACSRTIPLQDKPSAFAFRGDTIAVGLKSNVELLDAITGARTSALRGHTGTILSVAFSLDGSLLVSRSKDNTVKLWDIQTGGVIRTFSDHTSPVSSIAISSDNTTIALGTTDGSIRFWDIRTEKCYPVITGQDCKVNIVAFSPTDSRRLISSSWRGDIQHWDVGGYWVGCWDIDRAGTIQRWDEDGYQVGAPYREGYEVVDLAYASDGTRFVSCGGGQATVRDSKSAEELDRFFGKSLSRCCFSPDGRFVACSGEKAIYVWDTTVRGGQLVQKLFGHSKTVTFVAFSSSLVSGSSDQSVKFWQSGGFLAESATTGGMVAPSPGSGSVRSLKLFAEDSIIVTSDEFGVVKTWDLMTGICKSSLSTPAEGPRDTHLEGDTLIIVWRSSRQKNYHIWDVYKNQLLRKFSVRSPDILDIKISGDGSTIFGLTNTYIEALCTQKAEARRVELGGRSASNFFVRGSKVGISHSRGMGWDFGDSGLPRFEEFADRPRLDLVDQPRGNAVEPRWIEDTVTRSVVFHLQEKYMKFDTKVEWDGRYLLVWSKSGEVVVMDFNSVQCTLDGIR